MGIRESTRTEKRKKRSEDYARKPWISHLLYVPDGSGSADWTDCPTWLDVHHWSDYRHPIVDR